MSRFVILLYLYLYYIELALGPVGPRVQASVGYWIKYIFYLKIKIEKVLKDLVLLFGSIPHLMSLNCSRKETVIERTRVCRQSGRPRCSQ